MCQWRMNKKSSESFPHLNKQLLKIEKQVHGPFNFVLLLKSHHLYTINSKQSFRTLNSQLHKRDKAHVLPSCLSRFGLSYLAYFLVLAWNWFFSGVPILKKHSSRMHDFTDGNTNLINISEKMEINIKRYKKMCYEYQIYKWKLF